MRLKEERASEGNAEIDPGSQNSDLAMRGGTVGERLARFQRTKLICKQKSGVAKQNFKTCHPNLGTWNGKK